MKERIRENITEPEALERLYREDKKSFEADFEQVYPEIQDTDIARFWKARLEFDQPAEKVYNPSRLDIIMLIVACTITGFLIKLPEIFNLSLKEFFYYAKDGAIIVFFGLSLFSILTNKITDRKKLVFTLFAFLIPAIFINLLPSNRESNSINLAYIHLPFLMWCIFGLVYIGFDTKDKTKRIDYIKYNGDLAILGALILIAGGILTGITIGLFSAIDVHIEKFYMEYIAIWGLVSAPIVASYIIRNYPTLTNKIAPIIANIFSPLVLITLIIFLIHIPISGKDLFSDRDLLLVFNVMLLGVMGIIVFSVSETSIHKKQSFSEMILLALTAVTLIIDLFALSAIFYRLFEFGITPNRIAVAGSNILIFGNLVLIMIDLYKVNFRKSEIESVENTISKYLPVYMIWTLIVVFGFPILFGMK
ncbi:MAG: DUF4153 domain-containing protein [Bacteroidia bacterium]|nr:DUF4153 domain-containing protein [Bacteroidia bacterium]